MSRPYRFVRLDEERQPASEFTLLCPSDDDALLVGGQIGHAVQIWDGGRHVGGAEPEPEALAQPAEPETPSAAAEPAPQARQPTLPDNVPRAYNPFRRAAWVRKRP